MTDGQEGVHNLARVLKFKDKVFVESYSFSDKLGLLFSNGHFFFGECDAKTIEQLVKRAFKASSLPGLAPLGEVEVKRQTKMIWH